MSLQVSLLIASALLAAVAAQYNSSSTITERIKPTLVCLPGMEFQDNTCYQGSAEQYTHVPLETCPGGFALSGPGKCSRVTETTDVAAPMYPICPPGAYFNGQQCIGSIPPPPSNCPLQCTSTIPMPCGYQQSTCGSACATMTPCATGTVGVGVPSTPISLPQCLPGFAQVNGICKRMDVYVDTVLPSLICRPGFAQFGNMCVKQNVWEYTAAPFLSCPTDYELSNGWCEKITVNKKTSKITDPPSLTDRDNHHIFVHSQIHAPVNINNVNNQSSVVNLSSASDLKSAAAASTNAMQPEEAKSKCCEVVSPRICRRSRNNNWGCFHRRTQQCSSQCTANQIYLRPQQPIFRPYIIVMPPPPMPLPRQPYPTGHMSGKFGKFIMTIYLTCSFLVPRLQSLPLRRLFQLLLLLRL